MRKNFEERLILPNKFESLMKPSSFTNLFPYKVVYFYVKKSFNHLFKNTPVFFACEGLSVRSQGCFFIKSKE